MTDTFFSCSADHSNINTPFIGSMSSTTMPPPAINIVNCSTTQLNEYGLIKSNDSVLPKRVELRNKWKALNRQVLADGETRFFSIQQITGLVVLALSISPCKQKVHVHLPRKSVCSANVLQRLAEVIGATPREREVLECLARGLAPKEIAYSLGTQISTVRTQIKSVLAKLNQRGTRSLIHLLARLPDV